MTPAFQLPAPVLREQGGMRFHYVPLPNAVGDALREAGARRVVGRISGVPFNRAVQGSAADGYRLVFGLSVLRDAGLALGDTAELAFDPDPKPDAVALPEELEAALETDAAAAARFYAMTPGRRRSLAHHVETAKRAATRERRALDLAEKLRTYTLHGDTGPPDGREDGGASSAPSVPRSNS